MNTRRQSGQGMVEYTIVTALGILVLLGPGADVIRWTMATIKNNYQGYSYSMSLSQWPEFDIRSATPIQLQGFDPTTRSRLADTGSRGGFVPVSTPPNAQVTDFFVNDYRIWLVQQGVEDERATLLAGPDISGYVAQIADFYSTALDTIDNLDPANISSEIGDVLPPSFESLEGLFPPPIPLPPFP